MDSWNGFLTMLCVSNLVLFLDVLDSRMYRLKEDDTQGRTIKIQNHLARLNVVAFQSWFIECYTIQDKQKPLAIRETIFERSLVHLAAMLIRYRQKTDNPCMSVAKSCSIAEFKSRVEFALQQYQTAIATPDSLPNIDSTTDMKKASIPAVTWLVKYCNGYLPRFGQSAFDLWFTLVLVPPSPTPPAISFFYSMVHLRKVPKGTTRVEPDTCGLAFLYANLHAKKVRIPTEIKVPVAKSTVFAANTGLAHLPARIGQLPFLRIEDLLGVKNPVIHDTIVIVEGRHFLVSGYYYPMGAVNGSLKELFPGFDWKGEITVVALGRQRPYLVKFPHRRLVVQAVNRLSSGGSGRNTSLPGTLTFSRSIDADLEDEHDAGYGYDRGRDDEDGDYWQRYEDLGEEYEAGGRQMYSGKGKGKALSTSSVDQDLVTNDDDFELNSDRPSAYRPPSRTSGPQAGPSGYNSGPNPQAPNHARSPRPSSAGRRPPPEAIQSFESFLKNWEASQRVIAWANDNSQHSPSNRNDRGAQSTSQDQDNSPHQPNAFQGQQRTRQPHSRNSQHRRNREDFTRNMQQQFETFQRNQRCEPGEARPRPCTSPPPPDHNGFRGRGSFSDLPKKRRGSPKRHRASKLQIALIRKLFEIFWRP
ncbi:hypothetical protein C8R43DRAFT_951525 [Mycena crocata]|nr:hypothetical protein C8R43DRAFT_951525 [Mycena crocata]